MGQPGVSLVASFCRWRSAEHDRWPEKTWGCPIGHAFDGKKNDCPRSKVRDPVWNASSGLRRAKATDH